MHILIDLNLFTYNYFWSTFSSTYLEWMAKKGDKNNSASYHVITLIYIEK